MIALTNEVFDEDLKTFKHQVYQFPPAAKFMLVPSGNTQMLCDGIREMQKHLADKGVDVPEVHAFTIGIGDTYDQVKVEDAKILIAEYEQHLEFCKEVSDDKI